MSRRGSGLFADNGGGGDAIGGTDSSPLHAVDNNNDDQQSLSYYQSSSPTTLPEGSALPTTSSNSDLLISPYWRSRDCKELMGCILFAVACFIVTSVTKISTAERPIPFQLLNTGEYVRNLSFNEVFDGETIPDSLLIVLAIVVPWTLQMLISTVYGDKGDRHATLCIYFVAMAMTLLTTDLIKMYCGYLRPIFYTICQPDDNYESCTGDTGDSESYRRSFPSGHASTSFCGLTLLTLFIHSRFGVPCMKRKLDLQSKNNSFDNNNNNRQTNHSNNHSHSNMMDPVFYRLISILSLFPMGVALFIAASRVVDNKHFPADITAGSILGAVIANFVHGLWLF